MLWLGKSRKTIAEDLVADDSRKEVVATKDLNKTIAVQARQSTIQLNELLKSDPLTFRVYFSAGHTYPPTPRRKR